jgi:hypothetical protein
VRLNQEDGQRLVLAVFFSLDVFVLCHGHSLYNIIRLMRSCIALTLNTIDTDKG